MAPNEFLICMPDQSPLLGVVALDVNVILEALLPIAINSPRISKYLVDANLNETPGSIVSFTLGNST